MDQLYFLQDSRGLVGDNLMFWATGGGYTSDLRQAARFSKAQAVEQNRTRESDIPWPEDYIKAKFYRPVDMQQLRHVDKFAPDVAFYRQIGGRFIGNDMIWVAGNGTSETTDLRLADTFPALQPGAVMWSVEEIQKIARPAVRASDTSIKEALKGTGIVLREPQKIPREVFNCHQCGRFISEDKRYSDCPNCGADNRP